MLGVLMMCMFLPFLSPFIMMFIILAHPPEEFQKSLRVSTGVIIFLGILSFTSLYLIVQENGCIQ